jgi:hypothetical protein
MHVLLELYNHTNHQMAAHNIWEMSWPADIDVLAYIALSDSSLSLDCWHHAIRIPLSKLLEQVVGSQLLENAILFFV